MTVAAVIALLQTAILLLGTVQANPTLPAALRETATAVATQAIAEASKFIAANGQQPSTPPPPPVQPAPAPAPSAPTPSPVEQPAVAPPCDEMPVLKPWEPTMVRAYTENMAMAKFEQVWLYTPCPGQEWFLDYAAPESVNTGLSRKDVKMRYNGKPNAGEHAGKFSHVVVASTDGNPFVFATTTGGTFTVHFRAHSPQTTRMVSIPVTFILPKCVGYTCEE